MKRMIEQLYEGNLILAERPQKCTQEFREAKAVAVSAHDAFEEKLCQPMKQEFDEYLSKESDVSSYHIQQAFVDGFRLGAQLMIDVLEVGCDD